MKFVRAENKSSKMEPEPDRRRTVSSWSWMLYKTLTSFFHSSNFNSLQMEGRVTQCRMTQKFASATALNPVERPLPHAKVPTIIEDRAISTPCKERTTIVKYMAHHFAGSTVLYLMAEFQTISSCGVHHLLPAKTLSEFSVPLCNFETSKNSK